MKAVVCRAHGPPQSLTLEDWPAPVPGAGEVLIAARAIGVNYPDLLVVAGTYQRLPPCPFVPGKELAGEVTAVGPGVEGFAPGDRVMAQVEHGAFAEIVAAPARACWKLPDTMDFAEAAAMGLVYQTAHFALVERGEYRAGETVLVTGSGGGVGLAGVRLAKALGATVLAGVSRPERGRLAREAGADAIIDLGRPDLRESLRAQVSEATGGRMADIVLDQVGGDVFDAALRALGWCGRLVVVGFAAGRIPEAKANYLLLKNISVTGLHWSDYRDRRPERVAAVQAQLFALHAAGRIGASNTELSGMFEGYSPLASFDAKIRLAGLMAFVTGETKHDLEVIKKIRNMFAHSAIVRTFADADVAEKCMSLKRRVILKKDIQPEAKRRFAEACISMMFFLFMAMVASLREIALISKNITELRADSLARFKEMMVTGGVNLDEWETRE